MDIDGELCMINLWSIGNSEPRLQDQEQVGTGESHSSYLGRMRTSNLSK